MLLSICDAKIKKLLTFNKCKNVHLNIYIYYKKEGKIKMNKTLKNAKGITLIAFAISTKCLQH